MLIARTVLPVVAGCVLIAGCSSSAPAGRGTSSGLPAVTDSPGQPPTGGASTPAASGGSASAPAGTTVSLGPHANGTSVRVARGTQLLVSLDGTYWIFAAPSSDSVRALAPSAVATPSPNRCPPGGGCGTVSERFAAVAPGSATISAMRRSCGEALRCAPDQARFRLTVIVG
ncbi:MAG: hypothetical protein ACR2LF_10355 [Jatrophihabitantaceae bacterium]